MLTGRILDFRQVARDGAWAGKVTLALRLADARDHRVVFLEESSAPVPMPDEMPGAAVAALSAGTRDVLRGFRARCEAAGGFAGIATRQVAPLRAVGERFHPCGRLALVPDFIAVPIRIGLE